MLSTSDIRPHVEAVLRAADNSLSSYQILDRLPGNVRDQIIAERGLPGLGSGNSYSAASLVTDTVESILPSMEPPYRVYVDTGSTTFQVAGQSITAGNAAIAFYRLPPVKAVPTTATSFNLVNPSANLDSTININPARNKMPTWKIIALVLFYPAGICYLLWHFGKKIKKPAWKIIALVLCYPVGICYLLWLLGKKIWEHPTWNLKTKLMVSILIIAVFAVPAAIVKVSEVQTERAATVAQSHQAQVEVAAQAKQAEEEKEKQQEYALFLATPAGKAHLKALRQKQADQAKTDAEHAKRAAITEKQREAEKVRSSTDSTNVVDDATPVPDLKETTSQSSDSDSAAGIVLTQGENYVASESRETLSRFEDDAIAKDYTAMQELLDSGDVFRLTPGKRVQLLESGMFSPDVRIRLIGTNTTYWTVREAIKVQ